MRLFFIEAICKDHLSSTWAGLYYTLLKITLLTSPTPGVQVTPSPLAGTHFSGGSTRLGVRKSKCTLLHFSNDPSATQLRSADRRRRIHRANCSLTCSLLIEFKVESVRKNFRRGNSFGFTTFGTS